MENLLDGLQEGIVHSHARFSLDTRRFRASLAEGNRVNALCWGRLWQFIQTANPERIEIRTSRKQLEIGWQPSYRLELPTPEQAIRNLWETKLEFHSLEAKRLLELMRALAARDDYLTKLELPNWGTLKVLPDDIHWEPFNGQTARCIISMGSGGVSSGSLGLSTLLSLSLWSPLSSFRWREFLHFLNHLASATQPVFHNGTQLEFGPSHPRFVEQSWVVLTEKSQCHLGFTKLPICSGESYLVDETGRPVESEDWLRTSGLARIRTYVTWGYSLSANSVGPGSFDYEQHLFLIQDGAVVHRGTTGVAGLWIHHGVHGLVLDADGKKAIQDEKLETILYELRALAERLYSQKSHLSEENSEDSHSS